MTEPTSTTRTARTASAPSPTSSQWYRLSFPHELEATALLAWLRAVHGLSSPGRRDPFVFMVVTAATGCTHYLEAARRHDQALRAHTLATLPGLVLQAVPAPPLQLPKRAWQLWTSTSRRPLDSSDPETVARALLAALATLRTSEQVVLQWWLGPVQRSQAVRADHPAVTAESWGRALLTAPVLGPKQLDGEARRALRIKHGQPGWRAVGRVSVHTETRPRGYQLLGQLLGALRTADGPGVSLGVKPLRTSVLVGHQLPWRWRMTVSIPELAGLLAWPLGGITAAVDRRASRLLAVPGVVPRRGRVLAVEPVTDRPIAYSAADALMHTHLVGPTGLGKSTVLLNLICQDMAAGRSVLVLEPKGDLVADVLARVPVARRGDVVVIDPSDEQPVGLNPLAHASPELTADQLLHIFASLYADSWGPRLSDVLHAALLTLARTGSSSLAMVPLLLTNARYRQTVVSQLDDPLGVSPFWAWFEGISESERQTVTAPVLNKLRPLLVRPALRGVLGQVAPRFALSELFTSRKIVLVNLAKGSLGPESAKLLGTLLLHQLWQATLERAVVPAARRHPVQVFVDELQDYLGLPTSLGEILAQARGLGVGFHLAHQHLGQLPTETRAAVLANARTRMVFQTSSDDAAVLVRGQPEVRAEDLTHLAPREVFIRLCLGSAVTPYMSARTLPPPDEVAGSAEAVVALSRQTWGVPRAETDELLRSLAAGRRTKPAAVGTERRKP